MLKDGKNAAESLQVHHPLREVEGQDAGLGDDFLPYESGYECVEAMEHCGV